MGDRAEAPLEPDFRGRIGRTASQSTPWWPQPRRSGGPNIVVIVLDDVGFAQFGCYGSSISTPHMDALAGGGVRYTNFHVPALCSPTRASILTGRNHHSVGVGFLGAFDTGYPSYRGAISSAAATLPELLRAAGYGTYATGKWHLTPVNGMSPAGPFDQWPTQRGFDRYYGFLWGEDDQYRPELWYDQHRVEVPDAPDYHFSEDMVRRTEEFIADHVTSRPEDPFLAYVAFGACHAPHQAPRGYIERYAGGFDHGWDVERERVLERQVALGVVPPGTRLSDRDPDVPAWDQLTPEERRLYARLQEAFAGFMEHTDAQIGHLVAFLRTHGLLDDTVIVLLSDNGASGEGGRDGTINEYRYFLGLEDSLDDALAQIDDIGGPRAHNQYPSGWAMAGNTPLRYYKRFTHGGGVRVPFIVHWPAGVGERPGLRSQFHHAIDVLPTLLELAGVDAPATFRGVEQLSVHGTSMASSFADPDAPSNRRRQYFETAGNRAIVDDGWKAVAAHRPGTSFDDDHWELYDLGTDVSETADRATAEPERLHRLQELWWEEAERFGVLPLDDRMGDRVKALDPAMDRRRYTMLPGTRLLNHVVGPSFSERGFNVTARIRCRAHDEGVILAYGRRAFGFAFFVNDGRLNVEYNLAGQRTRLTAPDALPDSECTVAMRVEPAPEGAALSIHVDDRRVAEAAVTRLIPGGIGTLSIQCGHNGPSPVSDAYEAPFTFTGALDRVLIELDERRRNDVQTQVEAEMAFQ
jgi:arylsulfatase A-like enzyme